MKPLVLRVIRGLPAVAALTLMLDLPFVLAQENPVSISEAVFSERRSELREFVERFTADRNLFSRRYEVLYSPVRRERFRQFYDDQEHLLEKVDFDRLGIEGRTDYVLLANEIRYARYQLDLEEKRLDRLQPLIPFAGTIYSLHEQRRERPVIDARSAADTLDALAERILAARKELEPSSGARPGPSRFDAFWAAAVVDELNRALGNWYHFYNGYDPLFTWWAAAPYKKTESVLKEYSVFLREKVAGLRDGEDVSIMGDPIGADGLEADLAHEMIPYRPDELIAIGEREFAWCEAEMRKAAREMGYGDDWRAALEKVKTLHEKPGRQPELIQDLADEAVAFVKEHDLLTVPPLAEKTWRMGMLSPDQQKINPFFNGGETMDISFPTNAMEHADKLMSLRGNNRPFARATVHHELIPGHHLQEFMTARYQPQRLIFDTPFWLEGWALYWEMKLWDLGFPRTPEERMGMLFWRSHRAARILFSLKFHLGRMTSNEAVDFLVERVGHERANAVAEVRRSFSGSYPPLYQAAYMLGGLQIRALHDELVGTDRMTERAFHDAILRGGMMPIELVRARLRGDLLPKDFQATWRFAGD